jgi:hypothetical protein
VDGDDPKDDRGRVDEQEEQDENIAHNTNSLQMTENSCHVDIAVCDGLNWPFLIRSTECRRTPASGGQIEVLGCG